MEELLNKLIEKGWKPFWYNTIDNILIEWDNYKFISKGCYSFITNIRLLVSKESWLWQFVCENGMIKGDEWIYWHKNWGRISDLRTHDYEFENFWLIESSLKDESELEEFLLKSIKLD